MANLRAQVVWRQNSESGYWDKGSLLPTSGSLIARKFSLLRRLGNSVSKRLNFTPKAEVPWLFQARNRRISLYFPEKQGNANGDKFADDCLHRQLVYRFCRRILLSGIAANYPGVNLRKLSTTVSREPNWGSPTACLTQFSQVPASRFGSFQ